MPKPHRSAPLALVSVCVLTLTAFADGLDDDWVRRRSEPLVRDGHAVGLSVGYLDGDDWGIVHLGTSGRRGGLPDNRTLYEIGSISKVFTSLLLADAAVRGEVELDAPAAADNPAGLTLPDVPGGPITWLHLSTHRSGLPRLPHNLDSVGLRNPYADYDANKAATFLKTWRPGRRPGERREYSNFGASVLGYLTAAKIGGDYESLVRRRIAEPLGLRDLGVAMSAERRRRMATPHAEAGKAVPPWRFADLPGAGGITASMRDMMRFARAMLDPPNNSLGEAIDLTWREHAAADESGSAMGLGWIIHGDGSTRWHNGGTGGSRSMMMVC